MSDFELLRHINTARVRRWHGDFPVCDDGWTLADWSNALGGEVGEAQNIVKKIRRLDTGSIGRLTENDRVELVHKLADEIADVIIYADLLAAAENIDLWQAVVDKFNRTSEEYGFPERL